MSRRKKGAFTLYFGVIFMSILLVGLTVLDMARMTAYKVQAQRALELTANSLITKYDKRIQDKYGLFMTQKEGLAKKAEFLLKENFREGTLQGQSANAVLMKPAETKEQILEYMKYRGPALIISNVYSMFKSIQDVLKSGAEIKRRLETEKSNGNFLDALNQYRYFVHGWTFSDNESGFKYIARNTGDGTGGYFVRSFMDYVTENPYLPYVDMKNQALFHNANNNFDIGSYASHFSGLQYGKLSYQFLLSAFTDKRAFAHDNYLEKLLESKKTQIGTAIPLTHKYECLEKQMEILKKMNVYHFCYSHAPESMTIEKYKDISKFENLKRITVLFKHYADYHEIFKIKSDEEAEEKTQEQIEQEQKEIDTEWMENVANLNLTLISDAQWLRASYQLTKSRHAILSDLKKANEKAKKTLSTVISNLQTYETKVKAEMKSLQESDVKNANYAASVLPKLEDQLDMIALMRAQVNKVENEKKFDKNIALLDQMIQKLCIPGENLEAFRDFEYYTFPAPPSASEVILTYLRTGAFNLLKSEKFGKVLDEGKTLARELGIKRQNIFDKAGFLKLQNEYNANCQSLHIDFTKEQLFAKKMDENAGQEGKKQSASIGKMLGVAGKMFSSLSLFGSNKILSDEEYNQLPSVRAKRNAALSSLDSGVFGGNLGSLKAIKKLADMVNSWVQGVQDIANGFGNLFADPIGTIYVNEYIMAAFHSSVTGVGEYEKQNNLKFQDKAKATNSQALKLEAEIEYIIAGQKSDSANNQDIGFKILMLRLIPNALYIFMNSETNSLAQSIAAAITWFFPPLQILAYIVIIIIWAILESLVDVLILRQGQKVAFFKGSGDFILSPTGFRAFAEVFGKIAIDKGKEAVKNVVNNGVSTMDNMVTNMGKEAKQYIKQKTQVLADKLEEKSKKQVARLQDYVTARYQTVETVVTDFQKSVDNYIETAVSHYFVEVEKYKAKGEVMGILNIDSLFDTANKQAISIAANANMKNVIIKVNEKLKSSLPGYVGSSLDMITQIKKDGNIQAAMNTQISNLRSQAEKKLEEAVFAPLEKEFAAKKDEIKADLQEYLNREIDLGAEKMQEFYDSNVKTMFSGKGKQLSTTEKSNSAFKLGYEDYLRIYLTFTNENDKIFRILDLIQLREQKQISGYMSGVELNADFKVKYLFLPRLIQIAKKQSNAITVNEDRYKEVDFSLRSVAGY